jgi:limonene-1,2-epoxide hydrolase
MTERTDSIIVGRFRADCWVCGVFDVHDGKITLWRDYFDLMDLIKGTVRGLLALVVPSMRRQP